MKNPFHPGAKKLSHIWRDLAVSTALATTLVSSYSLPVNSRAGGEADDPPDMTRIEQVDTTPPPALPPVVAAALESASPAQADTASKPAATAEDLRKLRDKAKSERILAEKQEQARREIIGMTLLSEARQNFIEYASLSENAYSQSLNQLQQRLTLTLEATDSPLHSRVVVLDPRKYEVGVALGLSPNMTVQMMMLDQNAPVTPRYAGDVARNMGGWLNTRFGRLDLQIPSAFVNLTNKESDVCVLVPSSERTIPFNLPGLTAQQRVSYINRHESWHCLDGRYSMDGIDEKAIEAAMSTPIPGLASEDLRRKISIEFKKEAVADVGAMGDMIRQEGAGLEIFDAIIAFRDSNSDDLEHFSTPVLLEMRARITAMGIDAFRAMDDRQAADFYFKVTDEAGFNPETFRFLIYLAQAEDSGDAEQRYLLDLAYAGEPEYRKAVDIVNYLKKLPETPGSAISPEFAKDKPLTPAEQEIFRQVIAYPATDLLVDRAFEDHGKITPKTLIAAYGAMQEELLAVSRLAPDDRTLPLLMSKLQQSFQTIVRTADYVEENKRKGVDITAVEPSLALFRKDTSETPKSAAEILKALRIPTP